MDAGDTKSEVAGMYCYLTSFEKYEQVPGPFTSAGNLRGIEKLLRDTRKNPEYVHKVLRLVTDTTIEFIKEAAKIDAGFGIAGPSASGSLIGKNIFEQFAMPYLKEVVDTIKSLGKDALKNTARKYGRYPYNPELFR